jgi:asparagine synthase (glutamine-hydrolysing)
MAEELQRMIYYLDEPQADFAAINTYFICRLAREHGIKVLLSGAGGDDIFTGYRRHTAMELEWRWGWLPKFARSGLRRLATRLPSSSASTRRIAKAFSYADLDGDERLASYFHWIEPYVLDSLYSPEMRERVAGQPFSAPLMRSLAHVPKDVHELNRMLYLDCKHFLADHNLNYFDKMSMATGVEVRVPLLDPDLISLAARLPVAYKHHRGEGKWIFKAAMEPLLPREVIYRPKSGFGVPLRHWLRRELRPMVEDTLSDSSLARRGLFDRRAVQQLLALDRAGSVDAAYTILSMMCIELWCRMFLDVEVPSSP